MTLATTEPVWLVTPAKVAAAVQRLVEVARPRRIVLFGSYVRGHVTRDSDLDVLVVVSDEVSDTSAESVRLRDAVSDVHMPMDILVVRESAFARLRDRVGLIYRDAWRHGQLVYEAPGAA